MDKTKNGNVKSPYRMVGRPIHRDPFTQVTLERDVTIKVVIPGLKEPMISKITLEGIGFAKRNQAADANPDRETGESCARKMAAKEIRQKYLKILQQVDRGARIETKLA